MTILDLSKEMLEDYAPENSIPIVGNLFTHEFNSQQFDAVVFPFILHHTAEGSWTNCENRIVEAFERAHRWLKPNGKLILHNMISEYDIDVFVKYSPSDDAYKADNLESGWNIISEKSLRLVVEKNSALITIGIKPTYPASGYGYIQYVSNKKVVIKGVYKVKTFTEKPEKENLRTRD